MKSVLISIQPKRCELIATGKKKVVVRKTRPKLETPFKCYIYCTQGKFADLGVIGNEIYQNRMKVIGEFVCDEIEEFFVNKFDPVFLTVSALSCVSDLEMWQYFGNHYYGYGWHISNLVIYDKPRELGDFKLFEIKNCPAYSCGRCFYRTQNDVILCKNLDCEYKKITRPPQSWCYVEETE